MLTTAIALETGKGSGPRPWARLILILLALAVNVLLHNLSRTEVKRRDARLGSILPLRLVGATVRRQGRALSDVDFTLTPAGFDHCDGTEWSRQNHVSASHAMAWSVCRPAPPQRLPTAEARLKQAYVFQTPVMMRRNGGTI